MYDIILVCLVVVVGKQDVFLSLFVRGLGLTLLLPWHGCYGNLVFTLCRDNTSIFEKFQKQFQLLMELTLYQKSASNYCFQKNLHLLQWLHTTHTTTPSNR